MSPAIKVTQKLITTIKHENQEIEAEFLVTNGNQPSLLGKSTALKLGVLHVVDQVIEKGLSSPLDLFPGITKGVGKLKNHTVTIDIDPSVPGVARKHSRVPFHIRDKVDAELDRLMKEDIIEKVNSPTKWVSRIVTPPKPKKPDQIRICVDMREANQCVLRTRHVTPTIDELIADLNGATVMSKIDLRSGYHQLELDPKSRDITTFSTHSGLFRYKRLIFGLNSAAEIFQHTIQELISDIQGAKNVSDDIIVFGVDRESHDKALHATLGRLHESGLTVNEEKCEFYKSEIEFFGFIFSADGLKPDPNKVKALKLAQKPQNLSELRSFLGMVQYSSRFIADFATIVEPLRKLTKQDVKWDWTQKQDDAFQAIKNALSEQTTLMFFDPTKDTEIHVDASPVGLAAVMTQKQGQGQGHKPVAYASRSLSDVEQRYSQTEREALSVVWACEHFNIYILGSEFTTIVTDHKPLLNIWEKPNPPTRIARWSLRLTPYKLKFRFQAGKDNIADYMSRHPIPQSETQTTMCRHDKIAEDYVNFVLENDQFSAITLSEVQSATENDPTLQTVIKLINNNKWFAISDHALPESNSKSLQAFKNVKDELTVNDQKNLIFRGSQLVIPATLQNRVVSVAHEGHQGIAKTKAFIRSKAWFPGIDKMVEEQVEKCIPCQANTNQCIKEQLNMSDLPSGPWQNLSMDFCGPLPSGEYLLVIIDEFSRYPVVEIVRSTSADCIIPVVDRVFANFSYPSVVKTDNGPPFQSMQWKRFMRASGITHRRITPCWPQANAQAESFNKPLMKSIRAAHTAHKNWRTELTTFLRTYRCTPHTSTLFSPFKLMFQRDPKTKIPEITTQQPHSVVQQDNKLLSNVRINDTNAKSKMKYYADLKNNAKSTNINVGDSVLVKQQKQNKLSSAFNPTPMVVTAKNHSMITAQCPSNNTTQITRNCCRFKKLHEEARTDDTSQNENIILDSVPQKPVTLQETLSNQQHENVTTTNSEIRTQNLNSEVHVGRQALGTNKIVNAPAKQNTQEESPRKSTRERKPPSYLKDYVHSLVARRHPRKYNSGHNAAWTHAHDYKDSDNFPSTTTDDNWKVPCRHDRPSSNKICCAQRRF